MTHSVASQAPQPRDFVGYGPRPPFMTWPGDVKLAINLVLNYEEGSEYSWLEDGRNDNWGEYNLTSSPPVRDLGTSVAQTAGQVPVAGPLAEDVVQSVVDLVAPPPG